MGAHAQAGGPTATTKSAQNLPQAGGNKMIFERHSDLNIHYILRGTEDAPVVVFVNALGTDLGLWGAIHQLLPETTRTLRYDQRGQGLSTCPPPPYSMGALVKDLEALLDHLEIRNAVLVGTSLGGMVAQGLAVKRLDQVRAMVLSGTATKLATPPIWDARIDRIRSVGLDTYIEEMMPRLLARKFRDTREAAVINDLLTRRDAEGYIGACHAISGTDFYATTASLTLPTLVMAGSEDGETPPDLVREMSDLIKGAHFELLRGTGHFPMIEQPQTFAKHLSAFLSSIGHI